MLYFKKQDQRLQADLKQYKLRGDVENLTERIKSEKKQCAKLEKYDINDNLC